MAIHIGYERGGWRGLIAAGVCFIMPAVLIVLVLAWAYVEYGSTPQGDALLYGIKPVIIAIVLQALVRLAPKALKSPLLWVIGGAALALYLLGYNELLILFGGAFLFMAVQALRGFSGTLALVLPGGARWHCSGLLQADRHLPAADYALAHLPGLPQGRRAAVRQRLRPARLSAQRPRRQLRLADRPAAARRRRRGPVHAGAGLYHCHLCRLPTSRGARCSRGHDRHLPALVLVCGPAGAASCRTCASRPGPPPFWTASTSPPWRSWRACCGRSAAPPSSTYRLRSWPSPLLFLLFRFKINSAWLVAAGGVIGLAIFYVQGRL